MKKHSNIIKWATDLLISKGYLIQHSFEIIQETPWSNVFRFSTSKGNVFLKQPAPLLGRVLNSNPLIEQSCRFQNHVCS